MIIAPETAVCLECLATTMNENLRDFQNNLLCEKCARQYYVQCAVCSLMVAKDESVGFEIEESRIELRCPNCQAEKKAGLPLDFDEETVAALVEEYLQLHAEEKSVKERLDAVKEKLKQIADTQSQSGTPVTFESEAGSVKCTYRTSIKTIPEMVAAVRAQLEESVFEQLFTEKVSFDVNKDFDRILASKIPAELKNQLESAVKRSESATLTVVKK